ncbi:MAG TPA: hypothetical protein VF924_03925, partial [Stellaceae bacterium]
MRRLRLPRLVCHAELGSLAVAHVDCDAFYAAVEKRDRPELADGPVIIGGGARGVVLACCYVARLYGVRSAMPMFKALAACPDAVAIRPDMALAGIVAALRARVGSVEASLTGCGHDHVETEDRQFSLANALPPRGGSDAAGRYALSHRIRLARRRDR